MNKTQFVKDLSRNSILSERDAATVLDTVFAMIADRLAAGDLVKVRNFGTFQPKVTKARKGRNPKTGAAVPIAAAATARFRPSDRLRDKMSAALA